MIEIIFDDIFWKFCLLKKIELMEQQNQ
ncbi:uncharacterized protein METZ01_LOCUS188653 [marine metagenome]|uniref:Uncharacterized protein n=1 Tax=marine metagenome TaxID=408172 RepID=A0A382DCA5_9ZZZZ